MPQGQCKIYHPGTEGAEYECHWYFKEESAGRSFFDKFVAGTLRCLSADDQAGADVDPEFARLKDGDYHINLMFDNSSRYWTITFQYELRR